MTAFEALAEPNRRRILDLLRTGEQPAGAIVEALEISQPGVSKHLKLLRQAGLVSVRIDAQRRMYRLELARLAELDAWLSPYRKLWSDPVIPRSDHGHTLLIDDRMGAVLDTYAGYELAFERLIARPVAAVWTALTRPARLTQWLAQAEVELRVGGAFALTFHDQDDQTSGVITDLRPPHHLAWTWPHPNHPRSVVTFDLSANAEGALLTLIQDGLSAPDLADIAAGWHAHLARLTDAVDGIATPWSPQQEQEIRQRYAGLLPA
jgi:uncharacterized protein YndB with AHSA1/START domain/DNA-binding transcriptional ArsR family regulator